MPDFRLVSPYEPAGDQPVAIRQLTEGLRAGQEKQTLLGATGTGKTFTIVNMVLTFGWSGSPGEYQIFGTAAKMYHEAKLTAAGFGGARSGPGTNGFATRGRPWPRSFASS